MDVERTTLPGERSKRSARAFTLFATCGEARVAAEDDAGPDADLGVALGAGRAAPFTAGWRWREAAMSRGAGAKSRSAVV